jgi:carbamate kinase
LLLISTDVEKVAVNFNKPNVQWLDRLTLDEARQYLVDGQFGTGSMEPKIEAALDYLEHGGKRVIITSTIDILRTVKGETGT